MLGHWSLGSGCVWGEWQKRQPTKWLLAFSTVVLNLQQLVDSTTSVDLTPPMAVTCCQWEGTLFEHKTVFSSPLP